MNMHGVDWIILAAFLTGLTALGIFTRRYMRSVADFLAAGRCADRFLLTVAEGTITGTISVVAGFEAIYVAGLAPQLWSLILAPVGLLVAMSGFVIYRFRETRALTLAQFFEMRYSKRFRIFSGILAFTAGVINYGIFPGVSARFFVYFCGFPEYVTVGGFTVPTFAVIMTILLGLALFFTFIGGQVSIMITDFLQGQFTNLAMLVILLVLIWMFPWSQIGQTLTISPPRQSLVNPFETAEVKDFNIWFYLIATFGSIYTIMAWQGQSGYNSAAFTPHEAKMGRVLGRWRGMVAGLTLTLLPLCAYTYMHHPSYADRARIVAERISAIAGPAVQKEMTVPLALADFLPAGVLGLVCTIMVSMFITCDDTYLHSWGSIFIQDVILPFRKKPFTPAQHIRLLRGAILGVAVFAFVFSLLYRPTEYIYMYFAITGAIYLGGAGSVIIGGLYWKRGTTAAAWTSMITGSVLAVSNMVLQQLWDHGKIPDILSRLWSAIPFLESRWRFQDVRDRLPEQFPINGQVGFFIAILSAIGIYVIISLLQNQKFNLDRMLHRDEKKGAVDDPDRPKRPFLTVCLEKIGMTGSDFTRGDKIIYLVTFGWSLGWSLVFLAVTAYHFLRGTSTEWWVWFWGYYILYIPLIITLITIPVFLIFGFRDAFRLFRRLAAQKRDALDDGRVWAEPPDTGKARAALRVGRGG